MVRIPGSDDEWEQHVHTSGRIFLSNVRTFETRWLWTKWDINGRLFVRNTIDPNKRVWFDEMDIPMRIQSGNATNEEISLYQTGMQSAPQPQLLAAAMPMTAPATMTTAAGSGTTAAITTYIQPNPIPLKPLHLHHAHSQQQQQQQGMIQRKRYHHQNQYYNDHNKQNVPGQNYAYGRQDAKRPRYTPNNGVHHQQNHYGNKRAVIPAIQQPVFSSPPPNYVPTPPLSASHKLGRCAARLRERSDALHEGIIEWHKKYQGTNCPREKPVDVIDDEGYEGVEPVVGTSEALEKEYLRLTSAPKANMVRPPRVLRESLAHIVSLWEGKGRDYDWVCRQLKAIRQDYKVQAIHDEHVIKTYETHARLALQNNDLGEFNTCVAQVRDLYKRTKNGKQHENEDEFAAYQILYNLITNAKSWTQLKTIGESMGKIKSKIWPLTEFSVNVRAAFVALDYGMYSKLRKCLPRRENTFLSFLLMRLDERLQYQALRCMIMAYAPGIPALLPLPFVLQQSSCLPLPLDNGRSDDDDKDVDVNVDTIIGTDPPDVDHPAAIQEAAHIAHELRRIGLNRAPRSTLLGVATLIKFNVVLFVDRKLAPERPVDAVFVDCKAIKGAGGIRKPETTGDLITHAGSAFQHR